MDSCDKPLIVNQHFPELDGLRAIAVLCVVIAHCAAYFTLPDTPLSYSIWNIMLSGWVGVEMFFVLSSFLITGILIDTHKSSKFLQKFYIRRVLRIFPLYYLILLLCFAAFFFIPSPIDITATHNLLFLFHLGNWEEIFGFPRYTVLNHFWSLAIEEQFYLLWPLLFLCTHKHNLSAMLCIVGIVLINLSRLYFTLNPMPNMHTPYILTIHRADSLLAGALLCIMKHKNPDLFNLRTGLALLLGGLSLFLFVFVSTHVFVPSDPMVFLLGLPSLFLIFCALIILALKLDAAHLARRCLNHSSLVYIGKVSYGIYVYHWIIIVGLTYNKLIDFPPEEFANNIILFTFIILALTILTAALSYRFIERPILRYKDRLAPYNRS